MASYAIGDSSFVLSHSQFANYTLLCSIADYGTFFRLSILFSKLLPSGLSINLSKSELFRINLSDSELDWIVNTFGCKQDHWPAT